MAHPKAGALDVRERLAVLQLKIPALSARQLLEIEALGQRLLQRPRLRPGDFQALLDLGQTER